MISIYVLKDPRTLEVRYVGKSKDPKSRLADHLCPSNLRGVCHRASWIRYLLARNLRPVLEVVETCSDFIWEAREVYWIKHYKELGARLTNTTDGGEGGVTVLGRKLPKTATACWNISKARDGKRLRMTPAQLKARGQKILAARILNGTTNKGKTWIYSSATLQRYKQAARRRSSTKKGREQLLRAAIISANKKRKNYATNP